MTIALGLCGSLAAHAVKPASGLWQLCPADPLAEFITPDTGANPATSELRIGADNAEVSPTTAKLSGNVVVETGDQRLQAPSITMDREHNRAQADDARYASPTIALKSAHADVDLATETGEFKGAEYYIPERHAQGRGEDVRVERGQKQSDLDEVTFSTCPRGDEFWTLNSGSLHLDQNKGRGIARNVTLRIKDVPVLYLPYLSFPIDDRRHTGFLAPRFGYHNTGGFDVSAPFYWNIAPDQDATLTPRFLTKRGSMLGAEYRFLNHHDSGEIDAEYLPYDNVAGTDRGAFKIIHRSNFTPGLYTDLLYQYVSDDNYINDIQNNLDLLSPNYLERRFDVSYNGGAWTALARVQGFQTLDNALFTPDNAPYDRLPQLRFDGLWPGRALGLNYEMHNEWVRFEHAKKINGSRLDLEPGLSLPLTATWGYLTPRLSYSYTAYTLDQALQNDNASPTRSAPILSADSGLYLERTTQWPWFGDGIQTLEPRLFYLYVPFRNQDAIPVFDSTEISRNFSWLFLENRFTGADRLGDANQISTALTTRFLGAQDGSERLRASVGQVHYFDKPRVKLNDPSNSLDDLSSDLFAETQVSFNNGLALRGSWQWDLDGNASQRNAFDISYQPSSGRILNFSHRYARDTLENVDLALIWPLGPQWRALGRWNYSLRESRNIDVFAGLQYEECCWAFSVLARQHRNKPEDAEVQNSIYLELELKGLAGIGSRIDQLLERTILGYQSTPYR
ncbi:MAG: LPS assembly protein LptD [Gammaproteobacteria bacterium]